MSSAFEAQGKIGARFRRLALWSSGRAIPHHIESCQKHGYVDLRPSLGIACLPKHRRRQVEGKKLPGLPMWRTWPPTTDWIACATRSLVRLIVSISIPKLIWRKSMVSPCVL
jgi:hypothetical protein